MKERWIKASWGKFRAWQRVAPEGERIPAEHLSSAWEVWNLLGRSSQLDPDDVRVEIEPLILGMPRGGQLAARAYASWLQENADRLMNLPEVAMAESEQQVMDKVSVQIIS